MHRLVAILLPIVASLCSACSDVNYVSSVPTSPVRYTVYVSRDDPNFVVENGFQVRTVTERKLTGEYIGYAGLLIWVGMDNKYHAADLCCPHCVKKTHPLEVDGFFAECPICGEQYDISYGLCTPTQGICQEPLLRYTTIAKNLVTGLQLSIQN